MPFAMIWLLVFLPAAAEGLKAGGGDENQATAQCVLGMSAKYFVDKKAMSGSIVIININSYLSLTQKTLLETIHGGMKYSVMVKDSGNHHKNASHFPEKAKNYMMILENKEELLRNILQLNRLPTWNPHAKAVIYIEFDYNQDLDALVKSLIDQLAKFRLLKTIVLVNFPRENQVISYTWKPYSKTNCAGSCDSLLILDVCKNQKLHERNQAGEMLPLNMNLCPLTVYTVISEPYVMPPKEQITDSQYDDQYDFELGIEINILKIIAHITNMTLIVRMSNVTEDWGALEDDGVATGVFGKLRSEEVDVIVGNMEVNKAIRKWFDPSSTYMQDEITWCVPRAKTASTWSNLITIFMWSTWLTTFASILVISCMLHWFMYRERKNMTKWPTVSILMTFSMILGWGALFNPKSMSFRFLLFGWLLFCININTSYQSFLRSFLIHPKYEDQIDNEAEILEAGFAVGGRKSFGEFFTGADRASQYFRTNYEECLSFETCVRRVGLDRNFAVAAPKRQAIYQDRRVAGGGSVMYCFQGGDIIRKYGVVVLARKWFPMLERFNGIIRSVSENGLIWKWYGEVLMHAGTGADINDNVALGMEHMLGAFLFLFLGHGVCVVVFLGEIMCYQCNKLVLKKYR